MDIFENIQSIFKKDLKVRIKNLDWSESYKSRIIPTLLFWLPSPTLTSLTISILRFIDPRYFWTILKTKFMMSRDKQI